MATARLSENQNELLRLLRMEMHDGVKAHTVQWPSCLGVKSINLSGSKSAIRFHLESNAVKSNMQTDASSFEGWAIVVMGWLGKGRNLMVELSWDSPKEFDLSDPKQRNTYRHYQRYLYRVIRFREMFDWFAVAPESEHLLTESQILFPDGLSKEEMEEGFWLNSGSQDILGRKDVQCGTYPLSDEAFMALPEDSVERYFINKSDHLIQCAFGDSCPELKRQFPVGVFKGKKIESQSRPEKRVPIFTGGKSAIDLWAVDVDRKRAAIFELKKPLGNKKVGIVSELVFYANIVRDLQLDILRHDEPDSFEEKLKKSIAVDSYFLLGEGNIHPLLKSKAVIDCLNEGGRKRELSFDIIYYNSSFECRKVDWNN